MEGGTVARRPVLAWLAAVGMLAVVLMLFGRVAIARADGDPASDYLLSAQTFVGAQVLRHSPAQRQLIATVKQANRAGLQIRVAVISGPYDLGSIQPIWRQPRVYAGFLGVELSLSYHGRLLVVMPNGFGFYWHGHSSAAAAAYSTLSKVKTGAGANNLALAAATGVRRLAAAAGIRLASGGPSGSAATAGSARRLGTGSILLLIASGVVILLGLAWMVQIRRSTRAVPKSIGRAAESVSPVAARTLPRTWVTGVALLAAVAVIGTTIAVTRVARTGAAKRTSAKLVVSRKPELPAQSWAAGTKLAPDFVLRDQQGEPVSLRSFRGRPVLLTFIDPLCRVFCPLQAQTLNHVVGAMPKSRRPAIIAISVDPQADTRKDLRTDERRWHLIPEWHWAVGSAAQLRAVWKHYEIGVNVVTRRIGGKLVRSITHTAASFVIDSSGHQRGVFMWPFYTADVQHELQIVGD